jgi:hypothetical protein
MAIIISAVIRSDSTAYETNVVEEVHLSGSTPCPDLQRTRHRALTATSAWYAENGGYWAMNPG